MAKHPVCFWEINAEDAEPLAHFYKRVLEWETDFHQQSGFYSVSSGGKDSGIAGGIFTGKGQLPPHRALYVEVEDIDEIIRRVPRHGGKVALAPYDCEGVGRLAFFRDPEGHMIGLIQRLQKVEQPEEGESAAEPAAQPEDQAEPADSESVRLPTAHVAEKPGAEADPPPDQPSAGDEPGAEAEPESEPPADPPEQPPADSESGGEEEPESQE